MGTWTMVRSWRARIVVIFVLLAAPVLAWAQTADLQITKTGPVSANGGEAFTYTLVLDNNGPDAADGATFQDTLPPGVTNVAASCTTATGGASCPGSLSVSNSQVSGTIPAFPNLGEVKISITGKFPIAGQSSLANTATISTPAGVSDPNPITNSSSISTAMAYVTHLAVTKQQTPATFTSGTTYTYTMTLTNNGPAAADGARIVDFFRSEAAGTYLNVVATFNGCTPSGGAVCPASFPNYNSNLGNVPLGNSDRYLFSVIVPTLPVGGSLTIVYTMTPTVGAPPCDLRGGYVQNSFQATPPAGVTDPTATDASVFMTTPAAAACPQADLVVTKTQDPTDFTSGTPIVYTMTVTNNGPAAADGARISDVLQTQGTGTYVNVAGSVVSCTPSNGAACPSFGALYNGSLGNTNIGAVETTVFSVVIPTLPVGGSLLITYTMTPTMGAVPCGTRAGYVQNIFRAAPPAGVTDPLAGEATTIMRIAAAPDCPQADLVVTKTQSPTIFALGIPFTYTMTVTNNGAAAADGANLYDFMQASTAAGIAVTTQYVSCAASGGAICPAAAGFGNINGVIDSNNRQLFSVIAPTLPSGGSLTIVYTMTPTAGPAPCSSPGGYVQNFFGANPPAGVVDPTLAQESAYMNFTCADVSVNKSVSPITVTGAGPVAYTVDVSNAGPADTGNITFSDPLPSGFRFASVVCATIAGSADCGSVTYDSATRTVSSTITDIGSGGAVRFVITGSADTTPGTYSNTATATVAAGVVDPQPSSNSSTVNLQISNTSSPLTVVKIIDGLAGGLPIAMTFTGTVTCGTQPAQNWSVTVPAGAASASSAALNFYDGDTCTVSEDTPPAAPANYVWSAGPAISPNPTPALGPSTAMTVNVVNTLQRQTGGLVLTKQFSGPVAGTAQINGEFDFLVQCGVDGNFPAGIAISGGAAGSVTVGNLPAGAICTVSETSTPNAPNGYTWGAAQYSGSPATIPAGSNAASTVTDPLDANPGTLTITKRVSGGPSGGISGSFLFSVTCAPSNTPIADQIITLSQAFSGSAIVGGIPAGDVCTVTEQAPLPAAPDHYTWGAIPAPATTGAMTAGGTINAVMTNTLAGDPGVLTITKSVSGGPGGVSGSFLFSVACAPSNMPIADQTIALNNAASGSATVNGIPAGDTCTVVEQAPLPPAPDGYAWGAIPASATTTAMTAGGEVSATITNTLAAVATAGSVTIAKTANARSGSPYPGSASFAFSGTGAGVPASMVVTTTNGSGSQEIANLPAGGSYAWTETVTDGWRLQNIACANQSNTPLASTVSVDLAAARVTIVLAASEQVICTFTNRELDPVVASSVPVPAGDGRAWLLLASLFALLGILASGARSKVG